MPKRKPVRIRAAGRSDIARLGILIRTVIRECRWMNRDERTENSLRYGHADLVKMCARNCLIVACDGARIVGFACIEEDGGPLYIRWVGVDHDYRRRGIAVRLLKAVHGRLGPRTQKIYFDTSVRNPAMTGAAAKAGFRVDGIQWSA